MRKNGYTLVELIMVIVAVSVMAIGAVAFFIPMANLFFASPKQTAVEFMGQEILDLTIDGDAAAGGLKYSKLITAANATQVDYTDADGKTVVIRWDNTALKFYRNIDSVGEVSLPIRYTAGVKVQGKDTANIIFRFFDLAGAEIASPVEAGSLPAIKRIKIGMVLYTGNGLIKNFEGKANLTSGIEIKTYN